MSLPSTALEGATPTASHLYRTLLLALPSLGPFREDPKKTSVHLVNKSAFAGVHFRRNYLILTIKSATPINSPRVIKVEQVSKNRWHCDIKLTAETEIDAPLKNWLAEAYLLCG